MININILGSGAAPGVPAVSYGFGQCNPNNKKNYRTRTTTYIKFDETELLIDTSPDLRSQLLSANIKKLDAVLYTHSHADHLHGIDDLREINRIMKKPINIYSTKKTMKYIKKRFDYLLSAKNDCCNKASLIPNTIKEHKPFYIHKTKVVAVPQIGHAIPSVSYVFNDGQIVYISDCKQIDKKLFKAITKPVEVLILPLTNIEEHIYHLSLNDVNEIIEKINPKKAIINHMSTSCDYDIVDNSTQKHVFPAFDGMKVELK